MVTSTQANYALNISLHVLILFSFLTIFFFAYIAHLEQKSVNEALTAAIDSQVGELLDTLNKSVPSGITIKWEMINNIAKDIQKDAAGTLPEVKQNHRTLMLVGICMIVGLFTIFSGLYVYFGVYKGVNIRWKRIFVENLVVFGFVGIIEVLFFTQIATKYVPVTPDLLSKTILDRVKYRFYEYLDEN